MVDLGLLTGVSGSVRAVNTARVLATIRQRGPISRSELIEHCGLSKATVSVIVADLLDRGAVQETGKSQPSRGRSRILLEFNSAAMTVIGVQLGDQYCQFVRTDLAGRIQDRCTIAVDLSDASKVPAALADGIRTLSDGPGPRVLGVGIGVPGLVDDTGRHITVALSHDWHGVDLAEDLERELGMPVTLANRAKVAALGQLAALANTPTHNELHAPARVPSAQDLVYLYLGSGVITGIAIGGRLHFGHDGTAGDLGHVMVDPNGPQCTCGTHGCLQVLVGTNAILAEAGADNFHQVVTAVQQGQPGALEIVQRVGAHLGIPLAHMNAAITPSIIAVGGPTAQLGPPLLEAIQKAIQQAAPTAGPVDIIAADESAPPRGAAMLWLQRAGLLP